MNIASVQSPAVTVRPLTADLLPQVVAMHCDAFRGSMSVRLGPRYVRPLVGWFATSPDAIALVASLDGHTPHGYVMGAPLGYTRHTNRLLLVPAATATLLRPWLLLDGRIRRTARTRVAMLLGRGAPSLPAPDLPAPTMSLVGIGVAPTAQRRNLGETLVAAFEIAARARGARALRLSVFPDNAPARRLYEKCGWRPFAEPPDRGLTMFYYKELDAPAPPG